MNELQIHESLIPFVEKLLHNRKLNPVDFTHKTVIRDINATYQDCHDFLPTINTFKFIVCNIVNSYILNVFNYSLTPKQRDKYLNDILNNLDFRKKIFKGKPKSEFFSVIKDILPYYIELTNYMNSKNHYMVIMTYKKIVEFLNSECLSHYQGKDLVEECEKRFEIPYNTVEQYNHLQKSKYYNDEDPYEIGDETFKENYSITCKLLTHYFHDLMISYYKKTGYLYSPINDDLSFYSFGKINIVGYNYSDNLDYSIDNYDWSKYEFWAKLNMGEPYIKVDTKRIRKKYNIPNALIVPNDLVEEAFIKYLMKELNEKEYSDDFIKLINKIGIPKEYLRSDYLSTYDNKVYFVNPQRYEDLRIKKPMKVPTLSLILGKSEDKRDNYISKLIATYKGQHKEEELTYKERLKSNPKAYID